MSMRNINILIGLLLLYYRIWQLKQMLRLNFPIFLYKNL